MHRAEKLALLIEAGSRADEEVSAQTRLIHLRDVFPTVAAGLRMRAESGGWAIP